MFLKSIAVLFGVLTPVWADNASDCAGLPTVKDLQTNLATAPNVQGNAGGIFGGNNMWAAVVNRDGKLCSIAASTKDPTQVWPGSQAIAKAKAYTANAFSVDALALSTARLYTFTQPGHSLWSLGQSNLFNPQFLAPTSGGTDQTGQIAGGLIFFGG